MHSAVPRHHPLTVSIFLNAIHMSSYVWLFPFPYRLQDLAGYGVALAVKDIYAAAFGTRNFNSVLVDLMAETGRQGMLLNLLSLQL